MTVTAESLELMRRLLEERNDPALEPLLKVVRGRCANYGNRHYHFGDHYEATEDCGIYYTRISNWQAADSGALDGALARALSRVTDQYEAGEIFDRFEVAQADIMGRLCDGSDARQAAVDAVNKGLEAMP